LRGPDPGSPPPPRRCSPAQALRARAARWRRLAHSPIAPERPHRRARRPPRATHTRSQSKARPRRSQLVSSVRQSKPWQRREEATPACRAISARILPFGPWHEVALVVLTKLGEQRIARERQEWILARARSHIRSHPGEDFELAPGEDWARPARHISRVASGRARTMAAWLAPSIARSLRSGACSGS
jgi:hypothetical protein